MATIHESALAWKKKKEEEKRQFDKLHPQSGDDIIFKDDETGGDDVEDVGSITQTGSFRDQRNAQPTVDMDSVLALGYGTISAAELNRLISQGIVEEYKVGNKLKYRKTAKANTPMLPTVYERLKG